MTDDQRELLRRVHRRQREAHERLFELQGQMITTLRATLEAVAKTQEAMEEVFLADDDATDALDDDETP
jgi:predicted RNA-binding protein YlqC (UPF0109 family)